MFATANTTNMNTTESQDALLMKARALLNAGNLLSNQHSSIASRVRGLGFNGLNLDSTSLLSGSPSLAGTGVGPLMNGPATASSIVGGVAPLPATTTNAAASLNVNSLTSGPILSLLVKSALSDPVARQLLAQHLNGGGAAPSSDTTTAPAAANSSTLGSLNLGHLLPLLQQQQQQQIHSPGIVTPPTSSTPPSSMVYDSKPATHTGHAAMAMMSMAMTTAAVAAPRPRYAISNEIRKRTMIRGRKFKDEDGPSAKRQRLNQSLSCTKPAAVKKATFPLPKNNAQSSRPVTVVKPALSSFRQAWKELSTKAQTSKSTKTQAERDALVRELFIRRLNKSL